MSNPLPLLLAGGAILILASGKKKRSGKSAPKAGMGYEPPKELPSSYKESSTSKTWKERQEALKALSQIMIRAENGNEIPLCARCDPGPITGVADQATKNAVMAFQTLAGLNVSGEWGEEEDEAMFRILSAIQAGKPIPCDPMGNYGPGLACVSSNGEFGIQAQSLPDPSRPTTPAGQASDDPFVGPTEPDEDEPAPIVVADDDCAYILQTNDAWYDEQKFRVIVKALDGEFDSAAVNDILDGMLAEYLPQCHTLGRDGVGPGVRQFWDANGKMIYDKLQAYKFLPDLLEEDASEYGF